MITRDSKGQVLELIERILGVAYLGMWGCRYLLTPDEQQRSKTSHLSQIQNCLHILFKDGMTPEKIERFYKVHIQKVIPENGLRGNHAWAEVYFYAVVDQPCKERKLCFWCFNPGLAMDELQNLVISMILTSGTLAPLDSYASELSLEFPIRLENPHVISNWQVRLLLHSFRFLAVALRLARKTIFRFLVSDILVVVAVCSPALMSGP